MLKTTSKPLFIIYKLRFCKRSLFRRSFHLALFLLLTLPSIATEAALVLQNEITGIEAPALENAIARLKIKQKIKEEELSPSLIKKYFKEGPKDIQKAIQPFGYFKSTITSELTQNDQVWTAYYHINPGPPLHITGTNIQLQGEGKNNSRLKKAIALFPLPIGSVLNTKVYESYKEELLTLAQNQGYLSAQLAKSHIEIYLDQYNAFIILILDTGPRFYFGATSFSETPLDTVFLNRYIPFKESEPFSFEKLLEFQQLLTGSDYFQSVSVVPNKAKAHKQKVPIQTTLKMMKQKEYRIGIGYGTNTGPRATIGIDWNWINRFGHQFNSLLKLSHVETTLAAQYLIPTNNPAFDHYTISSSIYNQTPHKGESTTASLGVGRITNFNIWQRTLGIDYQLERYRINKNDPTKHSKLLLPNVTFTRTQKDDPVNTRNGTRFSLNVTGASTTLLSTTNFIQTHLEYTWIHSLNQNNSCVFRTDLGYTMIHDLPTLPLTKRFYTGGIDSVRGYKYKNLGPGRYLVVGSLEYQYRITGNWYTGLFYDIGNAIDHTSDPLKRGTGAGIIWRSPIGPMKLYVSAGLSDKDKPISIDFSLGPEL